MKETSILLPIEENRCSKVALLAQVWKHNFHFSLCGLRKTASPNTPIWQRNFQVRAIQHDHVNHVVDITKSVSLSDKQFYLVIGCFDTRVTDIKPYRVQDMILMPHDLSLQFYELRYAAMPGPLNPGNELLLCFIDVIDLEDQPQLFFQKICPIKLVIRPGNHFEADCLI